MSSLAKRLDCIEVQEFLECISPLGVSLEDQGNWVYRGVSRSQSYKLVPKSLRNDPPLWRDIGLLDNPPNPVEQERGHLVIERGVLHRFYRALDENGLPIPGDSQELRKWMYSSANPVDIFDEIEKKDGYWPPDNAIELLALAQHYGLPTRLLDWSRSPYHAAYFAVADVLKEAFDAKGQLKQTSDSDERLAVWVFHHPWAQLEANAPEVLPGYSDRNANEFRVVTVPTAANPNLHAQKGVFTLMRTKVSAYNGPLDRAPLDEQLNKRIRALDQPILVRVTLPRDKALALAEALMCLGVNAGAIYPGFQGAANSVIERNTVDLLRALKARTAGV